MTCSMISISATFGRFKGVIRAPLHTTRFEETLAFAMRETDNVKIHSVQIQAIAPLTQGDR